MLPHTWNNTKQIRFFTDDYEDMKEISSYLIEELKHRMQFDNVNYKSFSPYYLIITDDYQKIKNLKIISEVLKNRANLGFSLICITKDFTQLPNECKTFVNITQNLSGMFYENEISSTSMKQVIFDEHFDYPFENICKEISNIPIIYTQNATMLLPNKYTFLEMYDVGLIEQLNILDRWKRNNSTLAIRAPIGIDGSGMPISLDIHEKFHGPHGLIAGSTGSGKSEFIITFVLSLAINYHPDDVTFLLIDYKGGGLAGAFEKRDVKLPHLVGTITNIETIGLRRSLASIQSELRRRQIIFNEARNRTDEGTIDIYKYQKLYHEGIVEEPISHLIIICDEFAELKQQQQEFMDELISVSRIGRSLGVHLILATQKPAGIVNDQILSNSKFAICLKVQNKEDSSDVIKRPDAANLKNAGQFYMKVGNDDYFVLGQSAWASAPYFPSDDTKKQIDTSIEFITDIGIPIKKVNNTAHKVVSSSGEQLTNIVKYIANLAKKENIFANQLWLDNIPENIFIENLKEKYDVKKPQDSIVAVIGEYDDPFNQRQGIVDINFSKEGNVAIYGNAESGKETFLSTMVYDLITTYSTSQVQIYILDFGTEALKIYKDSPHVGDIVFVNDTEKISRFFDMIQQEIQKRKALLSDYNGDYSLYLHQEQEPMPMIVVILNNYESFSEIYEDKYGDIFLTITREGVKSGIVFTVTASTYNDMRYRLSQNFKKKIALLLNNEDDYLNIFEGVGKKRPSRLFGRGLINIQNSGVFEFQTAKIVSPINYNVRIEEKIAEIKKLNPISAKPIPVIPDKVTLSDVNEYLKDISNVPIGMTKKDLKIATYNFKKNFMNIITSKNMEDAVEFTLSILEEFKQLKNVGIIVLDAERAIQTKKGNLRTDYDQMVTDIKESRTILGRHTIMVIIGVDKFLSDLDNEEEFADILSKAYNRKTYSFVLVDNTNKLKNHEYDTWYKKNNICDNSIYIGNGIDDQYLISINDRKGILNKCGRSYGYLIKQGTPILLKLLGMKEKSDEF